MSAAPPDQSLRAEASLRLVVELPSWPRVFLRNLRDLFFPRRVPALDLRSAPAAFWPDVFVNRPLPWSAFLQSAACHVLACALVIVFTRLFALQPHIRSKPTFDRTQVIYDSATEYLPPLDTRDLHSDPPKKADPELSRQPVISVPREPDNRSQTIVTPPNIKLNSELALPNIVAWSDTPQKPSLYTPPVPVTPAAEVTRIAPQLDSVVTPPPDPAHFTQARNRTTLQVQVVAPPENVERAPSPAQTRLQAPRLEVIAPPGSGVVTASTRLGDLNIGQSAVIAPAPALPVAERSAVAAHRSLSAAAQVVPPPPAAAGSAAAPSGSRGRIIALNLHPAVAAPPDPPAGNRRGSFAATPEGHPGATGSPGASPSVASGSNPEDASGSNKKGTDSLPAGLYVGSAPAKSSPVAGDPAKAPSNSANPVLTANTPPTRVTSASHSTQPDNAKLTEPERAVFGSRKFYSLTLNMPNLNSAGGSWIIRFAEIKHDSGNLGASLEANSSDPPDLSQPTATRKVDPAYPLQLMRENVAGTVILYAVIRADGTVGNVRVLRGVDDRLDRFATEAVSQWKFTPATRNGAPVDVDATFQIPFKPARIGTNF